MLMQKTVPAQTYLSIQKRLRLADLKDFTQIIATLFQEASQLGLSICGPLEFIYFGVDGKPETLFDLRICLPIAQTGAASSQFEYYLSQPFLCGYTDYQGAMSAMSAAWGCFVADFMLQNLRPGQQCREVYKHWLEAESPENITELQMEIAS